MTMYKIIGYFASFEILRLLGFIATSRYQEGVVTQFLPLLFAFAAVAGHMTEIQNTRNAIRNLENWIRDNCGEQCE